MVWSDIPQKPPVGDPKDAFLTQASPVQNTWYTVLNLSGSGFLTEVRGAEDTSGTNTEFRFTIDGGTAQTFVQTNANIEAVLANSTAETRYVPAVRARFDSSLLVECRTIIASVSQLQAVCYYTEDH